MVRSGGGVGGHRVDVNKVFVRPLHTDGNELYWDIW